MNIQFSPSFFTRSPVPILSLKSAAASQNITNFLSQWEKNLDFLFSRALCVLVTLDFLFVIHFFSVVFIPQNSYVIIRTHPMVRISYKKIRARRTTLHKKRNDIYIKIHIPFILTIYTHLQLIIYIYEIKYMPFNRFEFLWRLTKKNQKMMIFFLLFFLFSTISHSSPWKLVENRRNSILITCVLPPSYDLHFYLTKLPR